MSSEVTQQPSRTLRFRREVEDRFGVLPNFFCSADAAPGLVEELWKFAKSAYLDSPLPSLFKERLFVHLSRFCEIRYCIVRHVGFLIGHGWPAGDADTRPETVEQVIEMLRRPLPEGRELASMLDRLERVSLGGRLPEPRTQSETDLFDALTIMFLSPRATARARAAVRAALGDATFELLVAYLAFIRTAHYWTEMHPELTYEPDMAELLRSHGELAALLLDTSEAALVQGGVRLRDTLNELKRVEGALLESESRFAFLLRLGDALRRLVDPRAIQGEASQLLCERLLTDRVYYAEIDEAQGYSRVEHDFVRPGVSSTVGRYSLSDFNWVGPTFRMGGPVVVDDIRTSPLIPDVDRSAVAAIDVGAFVAAPLIRDGRLVGALWVSERAPRAWSPDEVELIKETADRTREAIERARAEQLRDDLVHMVVHDLRSPLSALLINLGLLGRAATLRDDDREILQSAAESAEAIDQMANTILDVSRLEAGKMPVNPAVWDLAQMARDVRAALGSTDAEPPIDIESADAVCVTCDGALVRRVMGNLVSNGLKYLPAGTRLRISIGRGNGHARVAVHDQGRGVHADVREKIFEKFAAIAARQDSIYKSFGLGLAFCKLAIEAHGGTIGVDPGVPAGSTFWFELPA